MIEDALDCHVMFPRVRALVVEDEYAARRYLVELLESQGDVQVLAAVESVKEAEQALSAEHGVQVDVAFVDIHLAGEEKPDRAGLEFVKARNGQSAGPQFVLATAYPDHALDAYALGVVDYLLKPFSEARVAACLDRVRVRLGPQPAPTAPPRIVARTRGSGLVFLDIANVLAFESEQRLTYVHVAGERYDLDISLTSIERSFGQQLVRIHRGWLVRRAAVTGIEREDGELKVRLGALVAPVARDRAAEIRRVLLDGAVGLKS